MEQKDGFLEKFEKEKKRLEKIREQLQEELEEVGRMMWILKKERRQYKKGLSRS